MRGVQTVCRFPDGVRLHCAGVTSGRAKEARTGWAASRYLLHDNQFVAATDLTDAELELLVHGLSDDVAFVWVLIGLGLRSNDGTDAVRPSLADVNAAFASLAKLSDAGLIKVGRIEYVDGGPPGRVAPVKHVEEPIGDVKRRVELAARGDGDWEWSCWIVNTAAGDELAQRAAR